ncbi:TerD family protein [Streptomyces sp. NPDC001380]|uniref:TerD family protein n=1 Tax=Streptomyces sp. NPDC001380 TaxID=3364566 RepID=UPI0036ADD849
MSVGSGGARVSSGLGPFFASSSLGGGRRRTTSRRTTRAVAPSAAQLERARRQAERVQQEAARQAAIRDLHELRRQTTTVHLQVFPPARPPQVPPPPPLTLPWSLAEARAFHLQGIGRLARGQRAAAREAAERDAPGYLAAETARLRAVHGHLADQAARWWTSLTGNDEATVCEAVNTAFADNPAAGCAVGVDGTVLSVVLRQPDLDTLPTQAPGLTPAGRPTLKTLTKRDRTLWWLTCMGSHVIATLKEGFATAPGITAIDLAVLTRLPDTQRLGFVAYGRWTRHAVETTSWRTPEDALRFLDIGQDVACSVTTTASGNLSSTIKPLDTTRTPGLQDLLDHAQDDAEPGQVPLAGLDTSLAGPDPTATPHPPHDPYRLAPFAAWKQAVAAGSPPSAPSGCGAPAPAADGQVRLAPGQSVDLPDEARQGLHLTFRFTGADADLSLLLTGSDGRVARDEDFVFYNQPTSAHGAARLLGKHTDGPHTTEQALIHLSALPDAVHRVVVCVTMDVDSGLTCGALTRATLSVQAGQGPSWRFEAPADPAVRAMVVAELYRRPVDGRPAWKLRAVGQGWADGLAGLARAHGVDVD